MGTGGRETYVSVATAGEADPEDLVAPPTRILSRLARPGLLLVFSGIAALMFRSARASIGVASGVTASRADFVSIKSAVGPPDDAHCGRIDDGVEYAGRDIGAAQGVDQPAGCCAKCQENPACRLWVWQSWDRTCKFRSVDATVRKITKAPKKGVVSGVPFAWDAPNSLFCYALMQPFSYERGLLQMQLQKRWSIFGCDEYQVVSNMSVRLGPGLVSSAVKSDLHCDMGGEFGTALNTDIFITVWRKVVEEGRWRYNAWTVKADPDTAFFPQRLRVVVAFHPDDHHGLYLNNCQFGLHGPLEVLSSRAVARWHNGIQECQRYFNNLCSGPCLWGEDMFIDQCLDKVLKVQRVDDWNLISEAHCANKHWESCESQHVAFHPFKTIENYTTCVEQARNGSLPMVVA